ncbi:MAG: thioredoxin family protein [Magnetococcales bacterium]|nr:thioredoxin family protein [Magnetococcales bacterium]
MKSFKILGSGCRNCLTTAKLIEEQARKSGMEIQIEKITDMAAILGYGVMSTPGVVLDGKVVHTGSVPNPNDVAIWLAKQDD